MDFTGLIGLANSIAALGVTGLLGLLFVLWLRGDIHTSKEQDEIKANLEYREKLRLEAVADRKSSDELLNKLTEAMSENNELVRRSIDLNERLVEEFIRRGAPNTRGPE